MSVNSHFGHPKLLDDLQAKQDIVQNFLEMNEAESQVKLVGMDSDGEVEIVEDEVSKAEPAKISEVVVKVSSKILLVSVLETDMVCCKSPQKTVPLNMFGRTN